MIPYFQAVMSSTAFIILLVGVLVFLVFRKENDRSAKIWFLGCILMASGMIILMIRNHLPHFIGFAVNNFIMIYAMVLFRNSFWMIEEPHFRPTHFPFLFCLYHGLTIYGLTFTPYASDIGLVAAVNWTILYIWLFYDSGQLQDKVENRFFIYFRVMTFLGILAWALRIAITIQFDVVSASDRHNMNAFSLLLAHLVLVGAQFIYIIIRLTDERNKKILIKELNQNLENAWREKEILQRERTAEKDALLRDIHDGFGSQLASLRILVDKGRMTTSEFSQSLQELSSDLHLIVDTLTTEDLTLSDAIYDMRHRLRQYTKPTDLMINWSIHLDHLPHLPPRMILHIVRIIQEAIANALRHSQSKIVDISVIYQPTNKTMTILVLDHGTGLEEHVRPGRGVSNMYQRAREIDGQLTIEKRLEGGTKIELLVPLDQVKNRPDNPPNFNGHIGRI